MCRRATLSPPPATEPSLESTGQLKRTPSSLGVRSRVAGVPLLPNAESLPSRKPCTLSGALLDELVLVSVLAPLYSTNCDEHVPSDWGLHPLTPRSPTLERPAAWNTLSLPWKPFFSFAFSSRKDTLLEIESGPSLLRHLVSEGRRNCRILALSDSRVALGALSRCSLSLFWAPIRRCDVGTNLGQRG